MHHTETAVNIVSSIITNRSTRHFSTFCQTKNVQRENSRYGHFPQLESDPHRHHGHSYRRSNQNAIVAITLEMFWLRP